GAAAPDTEDTSGPVPDMGAGPAHSGLSAWALRGNWPRRIAPDPTVRIGTLLPLDAAVALLHLPRRSTEAAFMRRHGRQMTPNPNHAPTGGQPSAPQGQAQPQQGQTKGPSQMGQGSEGPSPRFTDWASI
ncbi:MAG: hypothetical protein ACOCYW_09565, partial [Roseicyclus sp.]